MHLLQIYFLTPVFCLGIPALIYSFVQAIQWYRLRKRKGRGKQGEDSDPSPVVQGTLLPNDLAALRKHAQRKELNLKLTKGRHGTRWGPMLCTCLAQCITGLCLLVSSSVTQSYHRSVAIPRVLAGYTVRILRVSHHTNPCWRPTDRSTGVFAD